MLKTFEFDCAQDGDLFGQDVIANDRDEAERLAVGVLNDAWGRSYADWDEMAGDMDGCDLIEHPAVMAARLPLDTVQLYRRLADGLSDMIDGQRLREESIPDDWQWLVEHLAAIAGADPGEPAPIDEIRSAGRMFAAAVAAEAE